MVELNKRDAGYNFVKDGDLYRAPNPNEAVEVVYKALDAEGGIIRPSKDHKVIVVLKGTGTATIKGGNSYAGLGEASDLAIAVSSTPKFLTIDSARFADKKTGNITITGGTGVSVAVLEVR